MLPLFSMLGKDLNCQLTEGAFDTNYRFFKGDQTSSSLQGAKAYVGCQPHPTRTVLDTRPLDSFGAVCGDLDPFGSDEINARKRLLFPKHGGRKLLQ